jgi:hypothetical protein
MIKPVQQWTTEDIDSAMKFAIGFACFHASAILGKNLQ